jgi:ferredoxin
MEQCQGVVVCLGKRPSYFVQDLRVRVYYQRNIEYGISNFEAEVGTTLKIWGCLGNN